MTAPAAHETRTRKHDLGPFREPQAIPVCDTCKFDLTPPTDLDSAREVAARHRVMGAYVGGVR